MEDPKKWIEQWCLIYPENVEFNGYKLRSKPKDCINKMVKFCKTHKEYDKNTIFAATEMYIKQQEQKDYEFTKQAHYFISKLGEPSLLENFCNRIINGTVSQTQPQIEYYQTIYDYI